MTLNVLIVDDDRAIRESLARALILEGYEVATAADTGERRPIPPASHVSVRRACALSRPNVGSNFSVGIPSGSRLDE